MAPRGWRAWWLAARPRTLTVAVSPVVVGTAVATADGVARPFPALAALAGALLITLGTNLANDLCDHERGAHSGPSFPSTPPAHSQGFCEIEVRPLQ